MTSAAPAPVAVFLDQLNHEYERLHTRKEDAFWTAYMGLKGDAAAARAELNRAEIELKQWLQDPALLRRTREAWERVEAHPEAASAEQRTVLRGWLRTLRAHAMEDAEARALAAEIVEDEGELARARGAMKLGYQDPRRGFQEASSVKLAVLIATDPDERVRRAAWDGLRSIENEVLRHGFIELVKKRNRLGRLLGGADFYDATVRRVEGLSKAEIYDLLDELEAKTRDAARRAVQDLQRRHGEAAVSAWNIKYLTSGDVTAEQEPYFSFAQAVERWGRSFAALNVRYRGARLVLDLVDRKGKYENGFMHGPVPAWRENGRWRPARIQFTANAIPGMTGAGKRAAETLFHEGGHAAHFANVDMPAPCFSQEFAPTSVAFAETQSMFFDSLQGDGDWQARYARSSAGAAMPFALIEKGVRCEQPLAAWNVRQWLSVCYGEKAIYEIPDHELSAERVLHELREVERRLLFLDSGSVRPVLAVPHLLSSESSAYYHGYVLAEMAVQQTRDFFLERDGHLVDNPRIGPELAAGYWQPGNSLTFREYVRRLTGRELSAAPLAGKLNRDVEQAVEEERAALRRLPAIPEFTGAVDLDAELRLMHGNELVAAAGDFAGCAAAFARWIEDFVARRAAGAA